MDNTLYTVKGMCILDNDGKAIICKYFDETWPTIKEKRAFEKGLFQKTHRANAEIIMFDGITCVYRSNVDLFFYVFGSAEENELILASVLDALFEATAILTKDNIEKAALFDRMDAITMVMDELVDGGIILETDAGVLAQQATGGREEMPLGEKTLSQALNVAGGILRKSLLT
eukprot:m.482227 g.482227  ORF g.482227 m.482227 type:complete len:173 (+) comp22464_c0_seq1:491-1009(+)